MLTLSISMCLISACGSLERRAVAVNPGDSKERVMAILGAPGDRQFSGNVEAWQYCQTGAGFGYHDFRTIWIRDGRVVGMNSYKDHTAASGCSGHFKPVDWSSAPHE
jgi:hypothetical protein